MNCQQQIDLDQVTSKMEKCQKRKKRKEKKFITIKILAKVEK